MQGRIFLIGGYYDKVPPWKIKEDGMELVEDLTRWNVDSRIQTRVAHGVHYIHNTNEDNWYKGNY